MFRTDPIYLIFDATMVVTAVVLLIESTSARRSNGRPASRAGPIGDPAPSAWLGRAQAVVEALTQEERRRLRSWMDERWPSDSWEGGRIATPGFKTPDQRITTSSALRPRPY